MTYKVLMTDFENRLKNIEDFTTETFSLYVVCEECLNSCSNLIGAWQDFGLDTKCECCGKLTSKVFTVSKKNFQEILTSVKLNNL